MTSILSVSALHLLTLILLVIHFPEYIVSAKVEGTGKNRAWVGLKGSEGKPLTILPPEIHGEGLSSLCD
jgi:hypothetical protein